MDRKLVLKNIHQRITALVASGRVAKALGINQSLSQFS
jgi:hypothetical protein